MKKRLNKTFKKIKYNNILSKLNKVAIIIVSIGVITTGTVFATHIIEFVKSLFTNSTEAIDTATENGYIQNVDMDFVYDNNIGIKFNYIMLDSTNLDIDFIYKNNTNENITSIELYEYIIKDENNNIIYESNNNDNNISLSTYLQKYNAPIKLDTNKFKESLLFVSKKFLNFDKIICEVNSLRINKNNDYIIQNGNWYLETKLIESFSNSENIIYKTSYNEYINKSSIELTETSLKINIEFNTKISSPIITKEGSIILRDNVGKIYRYKILNLNNNCDNLYIEYDISKYFENIDKLNLILLIDDNKTIDIKLSQN